MIKTLTLSSIFTLLVLASYSGCGGTPSTYTDSMSSCGTQIAADSFESYSLDVLDATPPWSLYEKGGGFVKALITDKDCIDGEKCLMVKLFSMDIPEAIASFGLSPECLLALEDLNTIYTQFYIKSFHDVADINLWMKLGNHFSTYIGIPYGAKLNHEVVVVDNNNLTSETWYRVEIAVHYHPENGTADIRVYENDDTAPLTGSVFAENIALPSMSNLRDQSDENILQPSIGFGFFCEAYATESDIVSDPTDFSFALDGIQISTDPSILKVGFDG